MLSSYASKFRDNWTVAVWTIATIIHINEVHLKCNLFSRSAFSCIVIIFRYIDLMYWLKNKLEKGNSFCRKWIAHILRILVFIYEYKSCNLLLIITEMIYLVYYHLCFQFLYHVCVCFDVIFLMFSYNRKLLSSSGGTLSKANKKLHTFCAIFVSNIFVLCISCNRILSKDIQHKDSRKVTLPT